MTTDFGDKAPGQAATSGEPLGSASSAALSGVNNELAAELAAADRRCRSWREKLDFIRTLILRDRPALTPGQLIDIAIYLRFLSTGEIACAEDGRHFRPVHHARIASEICERLARLTTPDTQFVVRKLYPYLPSYAPAFLRAEPLTRIRDIAHRNDIGQDLKREIKTTLQNKLHRCAGPEDLVTSAALLRRVTAPGTNYPPAFVEQFKLFHEELREFFNARSLDERLRSLLPSVEPQLADRIRSFLHHKRGQTLDEQLATLRTLTTLRTAFLEEVRRRPGADAQELLIADIALEDFAFVLLSELLNSCAVASAAPAMELESEALLLALANLELSGVEPLESRALQDEIGAWGKIPPVAARGELLRWRASLLRCRRLAEEFEAQVIALFAERAAQLGHALGVAVHAIRVFSEADVRSHLVFQVSKLATGLLRHIRGRLGLPAYDVLVAGSVTGRVVSVPSLEALAQGPADPVLALLAGAAGDEEIPRNVAGIVLAHELPHLSHLGVRARQAGVVFVACEETEDLAQLREFEGRRVSFVALPDRLTWENGPDAPPAPRRAGRAPPRIPPVRLPPQQPWIPLELAAPETSGGKGANARRLADLSMRPEAGFKTAPGFVVPFGVMEAALDAAPAVRAEYLVVVAQLDRLPPAEFALATQRLRELVQRLEVPGAVLEAARQQFAADPRLVVRSSANCEDLEDFAAAGLYESVLNVAPSAVEPAVLAVWTSLWTQRAALSRREAGIAHAKAFMAVLIQELIDADFSFVLHTVNPLTHNRRELYAEVVVGLGETLASAATRGSPYRLVADKESGEVAALEFANFSRAARPDSAGGLRHEMLDYAQVELSRDGGALARLGQRLAAVGSFVERVLGRPQDIEGAVVRDAVYLVQARPQPGLPTTPERASPQDASE